MFRFPILLVSGCFYCFLLFVIESWVILANAIEFLAVSLLKFLDCLLISVDFAVLFLMKYWILDDFIDALLMLLRIWWL